MSENKCSKCKKEDAEPIHSCPFKCDVHNDYKTKCDCCDKCRHDCAMKV
jgi:hypothetical protein